MDDGPSLTLPNAVTDVKNEQVRLQTALFSDVRCPRPAPIYLKAHFPTDRILTSTVMIASNVTDDNTYLQKSWNIDVLWILQLQGLKLDTVGHGRIMDRVDNMHGTKVCRVPILSFIILC
jgi:hypothetical protein